jgi:ABC-2 type transport system permease protein
MPVKLGCWRSIEVRMAEFLNLFQIETRRYFAVQWSRLGNSISWFVYFFLMFGAAVILLRGVRGEEVTTGAGLLIAVGWLTWMVASDCMGELPYSISEEARNGTLEQLCITPVPLAKILAVRSLAYFLGIGARGLIAGLILAFFIAPLSLSPAILLLFFLSLIGASGLGFLFAGLALVFKRVKAITNLTFSLMIFFTGSLVGLESAGWAFNLLKILFPLTWGISLMRQVITDDTSVGLLLQSREIAGLTAHSLVYLMLGLGAFAWGYRFARRKGTLGHY